MVLYTASQVAGKRNTIVDKHCFTKQINISNKLQASSRSALETTDLSLHKVFKANGLIILVSLSDIQ